MQDLKSAVKDHWNNETCGTRGFDKDDRAQFFREMEENRYRVQPFIPVWANFERGRGKEVLEVGVGGGVDHVNWARSGARLSGVDLTEAGIELTRERLSLEGLQSHLQVADAENLPFPDATFDIVYSYGVLHHSPNTQRCFEEVARVLKPGGTALIMVYNHYSWASFNVWAINCLAKGRPFKSLKWAVSEYMESPGTKIYKRKELDPLLAPFSSAKLSRELLGGDTLDIKRSAKYQGGIYKLIWTLYPRWLVQLMGPRFGLAWMIEVTK